MSEKKIKEKKPIPGAVGEITSPMDVKLLEQLVKTLLCLRPSHFSSGIEVCFLAFEVGIVGIQARIHRFLI